MKVKIEIKTPKGSAKSTEFKISPFIIGELTKKKVKMDSYVNDDDDTIYWEIEGEARYLLKISRNVALYELMINKVLDNKLMKTTMRKNLNQEQEKELKDMLQNQTKVKVIKEATAEELVEVNKTFWQSMKEKFKKS